jgi:hypothetical protein
MTAISLITVPGSLQKTLAVGASYSVLDALSFILQIAAALSLFRRDAVEWLKRRGAEEGL